jgi:hypothetical protein
VFDVPCVGGDPPVLVSDLVGSGPEHLMDDEWPLPRWCELVSVLAALNSSEEQVPDLELASVHVALVVALHLVECSSATSHASSSWSIASSSVT